MIAELLRHQMAPIVDAEVFEIESKLSTPYKLSEGILTSTQAVLIKLTDADGVEGWGEANPTETYDGESTASVMRILQQTILPAVLASTDPQTGTMDAILDRLVPLQLCAKGAVTMALLDVTGKRMGVPVATLLGGPVRRSIPVLWPLSNGTADEDICVIDERAAQGFSSFMLKMGTSPIPSEIQRVADLEARYGTDVKFIPDANQGWTREQAREFLAGIAHSRVAFVEQPLMKDDIDGAVALCRQSALPLSADESIIDLADAAKLAARGAAKVFSIKSSKNGGPLRAQRMAAVAEAFGIGCYMNSQLEFGITQAASLQHAVTVRNLVDVGHAFMSTLRLVEDPTNFSSFVRNGTVHLPDRAGLGVDVDDAYVRHLTLSSFRLPA
ncbi:MULTISPECIES: enolase C-terminal domain-like protein [unclassified Mesorhizobium]|uniref:enolase C-terminal domain-like protein n=1 Tax=unclassified Mesorhizobium TaxID=325217 RepID=UPI001126DDB4|nr:MULTISPECIES: enolase C-terminal domain-like protein [unclassified Mesorhizobium]TPL02146.1 mandelate racemase [Mesorhizobium sp. B2-4-16]TPL78406.1 mandelate racemase [Mesorhizobium sp. B2-4-3]